MKMTDLSDLETQDIEFNNSHLPEEEAFSIELSDCRNQPHLSDFHLWVNGELVATFKTFKGLATRTAKLIDQHNLERVA